MALRPDVLVVGASGAVWGVLGSIIAWLILYREHLPEQVYLFWGRRLGFVLLLNILVSMAPGISWEAHAGGGIAGFLTAVFVNNLRSPVTSWRRWVLSLFVVVGIPVASMYGLILAMHHSTEWIALRQKVVNRYIASVPPGLVKGLHQSTLLVAVSGRPSPGLTMQVQIVSAVSGVAAKDVQQISPASDVSRYMQAVHDWAETVLPLLAWEEPAPLSEWEVVREKMKVVEESARSLSQP